MRVRPRSQCRVGGREASVAVPCRWPCGLGRGAVSVAVPCPSRCRVRRSAVWLNLRRAVQPVGRSRTPATRDQRHSGGPPSFAGAMLGVKSGGDEQGGVLGCVRGVPTAGRVDCVLSGTEGGGLLHTVGQFLVPGHLPAVHTTTSDPSGCICHSSHGSVNECMATSHLWHPAQSRQRNHRSHKHNLFKRAALGFTDSRNDRTRGVLYAGNPTGRSSTPSLHPKTQAALISGSSRFRVESVG